MKISTKGRYAIRLMLDIALNEDKGSVSMKEVADRQGISLKYLEQIVNMLIKADFLQSKRGSKGGYHLTRKPDEYTVADILRVTEGELAPVACLQDNINRCPRVSQCMTVHLWEGLYKTVNNYLEGITIADILNQNKSFTNDPDCCI